MISLPTHHRQADQLLDISSAWCVRPGRRWPLRVDSRRSASAGRMAQVSGFLPLAAAGLGDKIASIPATNALVTADAVTTGATSSDRMHFIGGTHDAVTAGGGSYSATPLVMAGSGTEDVHGFDPGKGDTIDFRTVLQETAWDGRQSTLGDFLHVGTSGHDAIVTVSAAAHGAAVATLDLHDSGPLSMGALLAHAIT